VYASSLFPIESILLFRSRTRKRIGVLGQVYERRGYAVGMQGAAQSKNKIYSSDLTEYEDAEREVSGLAMVGIGWRADGTENCLGLNWSMLIDTTVILST
jgi:hypothetical protein